jgi:nucleoside-triphosphatase THEP1
MAQGTVASRIRLIDEDGEAVGIEEIGPLIIDSKRIREDLAAINASVQRLIQLIERGF